MNFATSTQEETIGQQWTSSVSWSVAVDTSKSPDLAHSNDATLEAYNISIHTYANDLFDEEKSQLSSSVCFCDTLRTLTNGDPEISCDESFV